MGIVETNGSYSVTINKNVIANFFGETKDQAYYRAVVFYNACQMEVGNLDKLIDTKKLIK